MTRHSRPVRRPLTFLDPLFRGAALVVEPHDRAAGEGKIRDDEADAREQLAGVMLDFRHDPSDGPAASAFKKWGYSRPVELLTDANLVFAPPQ
jgi:hypothetical protein